MKKNLLYALFIALGITSCHDPNVIESEATTSRHPVSKPDTEQLSEEKRRSSANGRELTSYVPEELYIAYGYRVKAIDYQSGTGYDYYHDNAPFEAMASAKGFIFGVAYGELWRSDPTTNASYDPFGPWGTGWGGTEAMTALGNYVYAIQGGTLWRVHATTGAVDAFSMYPDGWTGTEGMAATNGNIYAIQGGTLWKVNVTSGSVAPFSAYPYGWEGTEGMAANGNYVYAVQGGTLWRVGTLDQSVQPFSVYPHNWEGTQGMAAKDGFIFIMHAGTLYKINASSGSVETLGPISYSMFFAMTARITN